MTTQQGRNSSTDSSVLLMRHPPTQKLMQSAQPKPPMAIGRNSQKRNANHKPNSWTANLTLLLSTQVATMVYKEGPTYREISPLQFETKFDFRLKVERTVASVRPTEWSTMIGNSAVERREKIKKSDINESTGHHTTPTHCENY